MKCKCLTLLLFLVVGLALGGIVCAVIAGYKGFYPAELDVDTPGKKSAHKTKVGHYAILSASLFIFAFFAYWLRCMLGTVDNDNRARPRQPNVRYDAQPEEEEDAEEEEEAVQIQRFHVGENVNPEEHG